MTDKQQTRHTRYWRLSLWLVAVCLLVWLLVTLVPIFLADTFSQQTLFGWPVVFGLMAFGVPIVYLVIIGVYSLLMDRIERRANAGNDS